MTIHFKIVAYNIFEGGIDTSDPACNGHPSSRLYGIAAFLRSLNPAVAILTELHNFDCSRFSKFANQWDHPHIAFLTAPTSFHLEISSSFPLIELAQVKHDMHHGALLAQVNFYDQTKTGLIATHLNPENLNNIEWLNKAEYKILDDLFRVIANKGNCPVDLFVYLQTDPCKCMARLHARR